GNAMNARVRGIESLEMRRLLAAQYVVTDLGALGGDYSEGYGINNKGEVAGIFDTTEEFAPGLFINHAFRWTDQEGIVDLGVEHHFSVADNINDKGDVVGGDEIVGLPDPINGGNAFHPVAWDRHGSRTDLGTPAGFINGVGWGINNK